MYCVSGDPNACHHRNWIFFQKFIKFIYFCSASRLLRLIVGAGNQTQRMFHSLFAQAKGQPLHLLQTAIRFPLPSNTSQHRHPKDPSSLEGVGQTGTNRRGGRRALPSLLAPDRRDPAVSRLLHVLGLECHTRKTAGYPIRGKE